MRGALPSMVLSAGGLPRAVVAARAAARLRAEGGPGRLPLARWPQRSAGPPWSAPRAFSTRDKHVWSQEWEKAKLGATPPCEHNLTEMDNVLFVECGFGCDQHGDRSGAGATKAAVRACRNAIEFNSIPCIQDLVPGGRPEMRIRIALGVPPGVGDVDPAAVCAVFPYGKILPLEVQPGGLLFRSGRVVEALGDSADQAVVVVAAVTVGY